MKFKTNIMCTSCIEKVTPVLNKVSGEGNWDVQTNDRKKILTINSEKHNEQEIINSLQEIGYKAERVREVP